MSSISDALEAEVAAIRAIQVKAEGRGLSLRERSVHDRHFARLLRLIAPRIRHFTRAYGLLDVVEDAEQACAIALLRAVESYDPAKARFTTFINWQLRGELQSLRYRLRTDARHAARKVGAATISLEALQEAETDMGWALEDHEALSRTEALAAETLARRSCGTLLDDHFADMRRSEIMKVTRRTAPRGRICVKPGTIGADEMDRIDLRLQLEREIVTAHLLGDHDPSADDAMTAEQRRQIARRTVRALTERALGNPKFDPDALVLELPSSTRRH